MERCISAPLCGLSKRFNCWSFVYLCTQHGNSKGRGGSTVLCLMELMVEGRRHQIRKPNISNLLQTRREKWRKITGVVDFTCGGKGTLILSNYPVILMFSSSEGQPLCFNARSLKAVLGTFISVLCLCVISFCSVSPLGRITGCPSIFFGRMKP